MIGGTIAVVVAGIAVFSTLAAYSKGRIDGRAEAMEDMRIARIYGITKP